MTGVSGQPPRILIVDDERANRQLLEVMLTADGLVFESATGGAEALAIVAARPPDLILLDIMMPDMDGYEVASRIKGDAATRNIPIIMVTALDDRAARMLGLDAGAEDFLSKPVDRAELRVRVRNLLRLKAYSDYHDNYSQALEGHLGSRAAQLVESERLYRETFDASPVGIVHMDLNGIWLQVNQRLCELVGYSRAELLDPAVQALLQSESSTGEAELLREMAGGTRERSVVDEKRYRCRDGSVVWARVNTAVHRDSEGRFEHFIQVIEDITDRRALEAQVRQAGKMDAIGQLASGVAHDFNNLLTVILGFAELVVDDADLPDGHRNDIGEIIKAAKRASGLTKQLLAFSRQQVLSAAPLDLNSLIRDMTGMLSRLIGENIQMTLRLAPDLSAALGDRGQVEQLVMNLVVNAKDAMPEGGLVTIETTEVDLENSAFHEELVMQGRYVMIAVTDTGTGMTKETQRRLFEPFFTTKEIGKGTGLGLSTTYGIVKQSKGYIWVYSEIGLGTTFKVYLPRSSGAIAAEASPVPITPAAAPTETVLVVEDEAAVRAFSRVILERAGYTVLEAATGDDAEAVFADHGDAIDLVLADVIMPGCTGPELLERLHRHSPELRVLYMSGYTEQSVAFKTGFHRGTPFLQKPFTVGDLKRQVRHALDR